MRLEDQDKFAQAYSNTLQLFGAAKQGFTESKLSPQEESNWHDQADVIPTPEEFVRRSTARANSFILMGAFTLAILSALFALLVLPIILTSGLLQWILAIVLAIPVLIVALFVAKLSFDLIRLLWFRLFGLAQLRRNLEQFMKDHRTD